MSSILKNLRKNLVVVVGLESVPLALKELVLELNPVQSNRVEEALEGVHQHQYAQGHCPQNRPSNYSL